MSAPQESCDFAIIAAQAAAEKQASNVIALDVSARLALTDAFVIVSGTNERQTQAICDEVELKLKQSGLPVVRVEGYAEGRWILADFGAIVVHIQHCEDREYYALERLWRDCITIPLPDEVVAPATEAQ